MINCANNALEADTWCGYNVLKGHLTRYQETFGLSFSFPMSDSNILVLVMYLREVRHIKAATIENYLSTLRYIHLSKWLFVPCLRPDIVKVLINGMTHEDLKTSRASSDPLPVTLEVLL